MFRGIFSHFISAFLIPVYLFPLTAGAATKGIELSYQKRVVSGQQTAEYVVHSIRSWRDVAVFLSVRNFSADDIRSISSDAKQGIGSDSLPTMELVKNEIRVNGQATGIQIRFDDGPYVKFHGRIWKQDSAKSPTENYASLKRFLTENPSASVLNFLIPSAEAEEPSSASHWNPGSGYLAFIVAGSVAALVVISLDLPILGVTALLLGPSSLGALVAARLGSEDALIRGQIKAIAQGQFTLECSEDSVKIIPSVKGALSSIEVEKAKRKVLVTKDNGDKVTIPEKELSRGPASQLIQCKSEGDAEKIMQDMKHALAQAQIAQKSPGAAVQAGSESGEPGQPKEGAPAN